MSAVTVPAISLPLLSSVTAPRRPASAAAPRRSCTTDDIPDVRRFIVQRETLGHVTQVQRLHVEDVLDVTRVRGVRAHEALIRCNTCTITTMTSLEYVACERTKL